MGKRGYSRMPSLVPSSGWTGRFMGTGLVCRPTVRSSVLRSMEAVESLQHTLQQLEIELLSPSARKSERIAQLLADDFVEIGSSGRVYDKAEVIAALCAEPFSSIVASRFSVRLIAPGTALLRYLACRLSANAAYSLRCSIWQLQNDQWRMLFHQGTPCSPPDPTPAIC